MYPICTGVQILHRCEKQISPVYNSPLYLTSCKLAVLPPTNELFDKVMFLHVSVILSMGGEGEEWGVSQHASQVT